MSSELPLKAESMLISSKFIINSPFLFNRTETHRHHPSFSRSVSSIQPLLQLIDQLGAVLLNGFRVFVVTRTDEKLAISLEICLLFNLGKQFCEFFQTAKAFRVTLV
jgi:hypothetical protein